MPVIRLYLVHVEEHDGQVWHYIGLTKYENVIQRLRKHMEGRTRSFNHIAARNAKDVRVFEVIRNADRYLEACLQQMDETAIRHHLCWTCRAAQLVSEAKEAPHLLGTEPLSVHALRKAASRDPEGQPRS